MKEETSSFCDSIITEVDGRNTRSLEAHLAVGFKVVKNYISGGREWNLISLSTK
ncbi:MAG: hypothetical protein HKP08_03795 [Flavobacteriaceae bacterium]|nr:hypothetical protein [Flavobacteriaceae bacterium]